MIRFIYTFFVGLFLAVFIGTGIAVFHESPKGPEPPAWYSSPKATEPTEEERRQEIAFQEQEKAFQQSQRTYNREVSIIVLVCATVILAISLVFAERLGVVADGLLLGGIFTLLYGIIRGMDTDNPKYRFVVASIGLVVVMVLGYIKFTRGKHSELNEAKKTGAKA